MLDINYLIAYGLPGVFHLAGAMYLYRIVKMFQTHECLFCRKGLCKDCLQVRDSSRRLGKRT